MGEMVVPSDMDKLQREKEMVSLVTVYRVEDADGVGPYCGRTLPDQVRSDLLWAHNSDDHPGWDQEFTTFRGHSAWLAGFADRYLLAEWFDGWLEILQDNGFRVRSYEIPSSRVEHGCSGKQLRFLP